MKRLLNIHLFLLLLPLVCSNSSCSSSKSSSNSSFLSRAWHNVNAKYNGYFNAELRYDQTIRSINASYKDDFSEILPLYPEFNSGLASSYEPTLDEIIKKSSIVVRKHPGSKWADDSYILIGKSFYLKGDHKNSLETFQYINSVYKTDKLTSKQKDRLKKKQRKEKEKAAKKRKKQRTKGSGSTTPAEVNENSSDESLMEMLMHKPVRYESIIWLINTYTALGRYSDAETVVSLLRADENFKKRYQRDLELANANIFIQQNYYERAIPLLSNGVSLTKKKKEKSRFLYILAQLYQEEGNNIEAIANYTQVLENNPKYEMEFNAKMSIAKLSRKEGNPSEDIKKLLTSMLKDSKNTEYYDQIYYTLAEWALSDGNKAEGIQYLNKSIETSVSNQDQKALSYLKLGELYFDDKKYIEAQPYYDSTIAILSPTYPEFATIADRNEILVELVKQMQVIKDQDSLQYLASLSPSEREKIINAIKLKKQEEEEIAKRLQEQQTSTPQQNLLDINKNNPAAKQTDGTGQQWYFYNASIKGVGFNSFQKKWGQRTREDHWRRNNKQSIADSDLLYMDDDDFSKMDSAGQENITDLEIDSDAPLDDAGKAKSDLAIINAHFLMADIYNTRLKNQTQAIETFEALDKRYSSFERRPEMLYHLYLLYSKKGSGKADQVRDELLNKYPSSVYARYINDPTILADQDSKDNAYDFYAATYNHYERAEYDVVLDRKKSADTLFIKHELQPKFELLAALTHGQKQDLQQYQTLLEGIIVKYPNDEVRKKAEDLLWHLRNYNNKNKVKENNTENLPEPDSVYLDYPKGPHYFVLTYKDKNVPVNPLINKISDFNQANFKLKTFQVSSLISNKSDNVIVIKTFADREEAMGYYKKFISTETLTSDIDKATLNIFVIYEKNFGKMVRENDYNKYKDFFTATYLSKP